MADDDAHLLVVSAGSHQDGVTHRTRPMSNRFFPGMPTIPFDVEAQLAINGVSATDAGEMLYEQVASRFYDTPAQFAADFADYVGAKRQWTDERVEELRWSLSERLAPNTPALPDADAAE